MEDPVPVRQEDVVLISVQAYLVLFSLGVLCISWWGDKLLLEHLLGSPEIIPQILMGCGFAATFLCCYYLGLWFFDWVQRAEADLVQMIGDLSLTQVFVLAFVSSVGEEVFFRGALQPLIGLWLASLIFGFAHLPATKNLYFYPILATIVGVGLGLMFEVSGEGLIAPTTAHFLINFFGLLRISWKFKKSLPNRLNGDNQQ